MKISTQASTFLVLVAAILGMGLYVNSIDIDSDTSTVEETLLPQAYSDGDLATIKGFGFRYPSGWQTSTAADVITLRSPRSDIITSYSFTMSLSNDADSQPVDLIEGDNAAAAQPVARPAGEALQTVTTDDTGAVALQEAIRLSDDVVLDIRSVDPIPQVDWDKLQPDYDRIINSIKTDDLRVLHDAFTYEIPDDWTPGQMAPYQVFASNTVEQGGSPERVVLVVALPTPLMSTYLTSRQFITPGVLDSTIENPVGMIAAVQANEAAGVTQGGTDVQYFGFDGSEMVISPAPGIFISVAVVDPKDGNYIAVITQKTGDDASGISEVLDSMTYTTPDPSVFSALGQ